MKPPVPKKVAVIGAGIVGVATALWLRRDGYEVTLIDRLPPGEATSHGNAGVLAAASVVPVTVPGLIWKAPQMLFDPDKPLFLKWRYLPKLLPWLVPYLSHARPEAVERIAGALAPLLFDTLQQHQALAEGTPAARFIKQGDYVYVYADRKAYEADAYGWGVKQRQGYKHEVLEGQAVVDYDPVFGPIVGCLAVQPEHGYISDPGAYVKALAAAFERLGGVRRETEALDFRFGPAGLEAVETKDGPVAAAAAVVAAGAWSDKLARRIDLKVPLETERGYHLELVEPSAMPRGPSLVAGSGFVATPMEGRLRAAGIDEFGGFDAPPSKAPIELLMRKVKQIMPGLTWKDTRTWMGHRPATTDSVPVIGALARRPEIHFAFGHHHVGLTGGAKTGRLIADAIAGRQANFSLEPYSPERFV